MKSNSSIFILIVTVLLVVGVLAYFFLHKSTPTSTTPGLVSTNTGTTSTVPTASASGSTGDQVVSLLRNLSVIQLDDSVLQNPSFALLQDLSIQLPPITNQGRRNPFAPVGTDTTTTATPTINASAPTTFQLPGAGN